MDDGVASLERYVGLLRAWGAEDIPHSGVTLLGHLIGTSRILSGWERDRTVCLGGLFHSVYGIRALGIRTGVERREVQAAIGETAEHLVWSFHVLDWKRLHRDLAGLPTPSTGETGTRDGLVHLLAANFIEQSHRVDRSGQAARVGGILRLVPALSPRARRDTLEALSGVLDHDE